MSSRALRRLQKQSQDQSLSADNDLEDISSEDEHVQYSNPMSKFNLLQGDLELDDNEEEEEEEAEILEVGGNSPVSDQTESKNLESTKSKKKKKQKKKKTPNVKNSKDILEDDFDKMISDLKIESEDKSSSMGENQDDQYHGIFNVDLDYLDPNVEMRRKVGIVDTFDRDFQSNIPDNLPASLAKKLKNRSRGIRRYKKQLIVPRPTWKLVTSALVEIGLERLFGHDLYGDSAFQLVPNPNYIQQFEEFIILVETGNIEMIYSFVHKNPLHVDALLVVSDFLRMSSTADASELTERALYILEKCTMVTSESGVDLTNGKLRLPYDKFDNRRMHLALFRYIQFLTKKGCYMTALQFSKILWSLDPLVDPLCVRLICDFLALQAGQFNWFDQVYEENINKEFPWLTNWHFSASLSLFLQGNTELAASKLQGAINRFPWMIPRLASFCGIQINEDSWKSSFNIPSSVTNNQASVLREGISKIYAQRCGPIWKSPKNCTFLEDAIGMALSLRLSQTSSSKMVETYEPSLFECLPIFRHSLISDLKDVAVVLPKILNGPIHMYDPLPPEDLDEDDQASKCLIQ